jgi:hypothetical protein
VVVEKRGKALIRLVNIKGIRTPTLVAMNKRKRKALVR